MVHWLSTDAARYWDRWLLLFCLFNVINHSERCVEWSSELLRVMYRNLFIFVYISIRCRCILVSTPTHFVSIRSWCFLAAVILIRIPDFYWMLPALLHCARKSNFNWPITVSLCCLSFRFPWYRCIAKLFLFSQLCFKGFVFFPVNLHGFGSCLESKEK